ncbi:right-handed parallel beta-helix repeat-containing protein [Curtobacterium sp. 20TX0008]|uniref:right-handed parallel beta-helix repeat-containing protein n=1 Tax=Curtobacterium sp. 20TX0008 TaxID=3022018 RepID=UPI0023311F5B|nr:right-handed parallel beta-helix repeat-containing protein [Curtobacterium sp. 20TX0008]MDB6426806.1 right-handed parallel beta-helix repeat-containing protein [Curtobacterium sp. 20TX0008]
MTRRPRRLRSHLVVGAAGLAVGALVVGGVWAATSGADRGDEQAARPRPTPSVEQTPAATPNGVPDTRATPDATATGSPDAGTGQASPVDTARCEAAATTTVSTAKALEKALDDARAGAVIRLASGTYTGRFEASAAGSSDAPVTLCGPRDAVLDGGDVEGGYVLHLDGASYWRLEGFTVRNGQKGVMFDDVQHSTVDGLTVTDIGDEGIHLRADSSDNTVRGNSVSRTGLRKPQFGEGIYIGSSKSNWCKVSDCREDRSDRNVVTGNTIADTAAENVDIKEGTTGGTLSDNSFDGVGMQGENHADSWVDVKGNGWTVTGNRGVRSPLDGFQTHELLSGWGTDNTFTDNRVDLGNTDGVAFALRPVEGNTVSCDNTVVGSNEFSTTACTD